MIGFLFLRVLGELTCENCLVSSLNGPFHLQKIRRDRMVAKAIEEEDRSNRELRATCDLRPAQCLGSELK